MLYFLQRHPIPVKAFFRHSLVLTYAFPKDLLQPLLPPGLILDTYGEYGFLAIAMVQTEHLRPEFMPEFLGQNFFLTGYRIFARFKTKSGQTLRGLRILRSDTDNGLMAFSGNLLTHYHYRKANVTMTANDRLLDIAIKTPGAEADIKVRADLSSCPAALPEGSCFSDLREARKFAGPLPFTFDYEAETHSIVMIEGVRKDWDPQPIKVEISENTFLQREPFCQVKPILANAFHVQNISYMWKRGIREPLDN